ncbi:hypothetical protein [Janibacter sp. GXQ6167]|uniref:hypothetical protein n=1 Tax=Janibacter sp. GXQ6167 TaxID=3240791 RepID=UPI0035242E06
MNAGPIVPEVAPLTAAQRRGLHKLGDIVIPGDPEAGLPSFTDSGVADEVHRMLAWMYESDRSAVLMMLDAFARMPRPAVRAVVEATERGDRAPGPLGAGLRMASFGVKGLIVSLYYSGVDRGGVVHGAIGYDATITAHPEEPDRSLASSASLPPSGLAPLHPTPSQPEVSV